MSRELQPTIVFFLARASAKSNATLETAIALRLRQVPVLFWFKNSYDYWRSRMIKDLERHVAFQIGFIGVWPVHGCTASAGTGVSPDLRSE